jgi:hypothetical protein
MNTWEKDIITSLNSRSLVSLHVKVVRQKDVDGSQSQKRLCMHVS